MQKPQVLLVIAAIIALLVWVLLQTSPELVESLGGTNADSATAVIVLAVMFAFLGSLALFGLLATVSRRRRHRRHRRRS